MLTGPPGIAAAGLSVFRGAQPRRNERSHDTVIDPIDLPVVDLSRRRYDLETVAFPATQLSAYPISVLWSKGRSTPATVLIGEELRTGGLNSYLPGSKRSGLGNCALM